MQHIIHHRVVRETLRSNWINSHVIMKCIITILTAKPDEFSTDFKITGDVLADEQN